MLDEFIWPVRVYYEDTDAGGVVYHANYLRFMERARNEWLRSMGWPVGLIAQRHKTLFVVRSVEMKFLRPAQLDDHLQVSASMLNMKKASMLIAQQVRIENNQQTTVLLKARIELATVSSESFRPVAVPDFLKP